MKSDISTKLATDTAFFSQLIADIKKGEIKIPQFQRKFVWKDGQALALLDSVANRYPIGSILLLSLIHISSRGIPCSSSRMDEEGGRSRSAKSRQEQREKHDLGCT